MATQQYHSIQRLISNTVQAHIEQEVDANLLLRDTWQAVEKCFMQIYSTYGE
jgi:hypothetical protein